MEERGTISAIRGIRGRLFCLPFLLLCVALPLIAGCVSGRPSEVRLSKDVRLPERAVVVLLVDGLDDGVLHAMMAAGKLPNIAANLYARGVTVQSAVTCIPSITFAANTSIVTGRFPGHHGITGNRWFDRRTLRLMDYDGIRDYREVNGDYAAPTLFEMAPELYSAVILLPENRGATRPIANWMTAGLTWFFGDPPMLDQLTADRMDLIAEEAEKIRRWPDVILAYFWAPDIVGHKHSKDSRQYEQIVLNLDRQVGRVCDALRQAGVYDRTLLVLLADHGFATTKPRQHVRMLDLLERDFGFKTMYDDSEGRTYAQRRRRYGGCRVAMADDGDRRAVIYLRVGDDWRDVPTLDRIERFHKDYGSAGVRGFDGPFWNLLLERVKPAGQLVAVRAGEGRALISDGQGTAVIERRLDGDRVHPFRSRASSYAYRVTGGLDPLGLADEHVTLGDGQFHSSLDWLEATAATNWPDLVPQIVEYFDSPRSGEIILFAQPGWDFSRNDLGGHGGVTPQEMHVPMVFAGPGLRRNTAIPVARNVDLLPTLLDFLGRLDALQNVGPIDGVSRLGELRPPPPSSQRQ